MVRRQNEDTIESVAKEILLRQKSQRRGAGLTGAVILGFVLFIAGLVVGVCVGRGAQMLWEDHKIETGTYRVAQVLMYTIVLGAPVLGVWLGWRMAWHDEKADAAIERLEALRALEREAPMADRVRPQGFDVIHDDDSTNSRT